MAFLRLVTSGQRAVRPLQTHVSVPLPVVTTAAPVLTISSGRTAEAPTAAPSDRPIPVDPYLPPPLIYPPGGGLPHY